MTVAIELDNRSSAALDETELRRVLEAALAAEGINDGEVGVALVDEPEMAELNAAHRGKPVATDVLSFPLDGRDAIARRPAASAGRSGRSARRGPRRTARRSRCWSSTAPCTCWAGTTRPTAARCSTARTPCCRRWRVPQSLRSREEAVREARRLGPFRAARHEAASLVTSFNYAFEGIIYVVRTQRNMRVHFAVALGILPVAVALGVTRFELLAVMLAVSFVLIAEMINTALEKAIDVATNSFDPLARVAKDVAAGAVLVAAVNAVFVGYLVFADRLRDPSRHAIDTVRDSPVHLTVIAVAVVTMLVISLKAATNRGTPLRGGLPSGHAAVAYGGWVAVTFAAADYTHGLLISGICFMMATLVAQTRVEAGVHTTGEVVLGGLLGASVTALVFRLLT